MEKVEKKSVERSQRFSNRVENRNWDLVGLPLDLVTLRPSLKLIWHVTVAVVSQCSLLCLWSLRCLLWWAWLCIHFAMTHLALSQKSAKPPTFGKLCSLRSSICPSFESKNGSFFFRFHHLCHARLSECFNSKSWKSRDAYDSSRGEEFLGVAPTVHVCSNFPPTPWEKWKQRDCCFFRFFHALFRDVETEGRCSQATGSRKGSQVCLKHAREVAKGTGFGYICLWSSSDSCYGITPQKAMDTILEKQPKLADMSGFLELHLSCLLQFPPHLCWYCHGKI